MARTSIYSWFQLYKTGGISKVLEESPQRVRLKKLEIETVAKILNSLSEDIIDSLTGWQSIKDALYL